MFMFGIKAYLPPRPGSALLRIDWLTSRLQALRRLRKRLVQDLSDYLEPEIHVHARNFGQLIHGGRPEDLETHLHHLRGLYRVVAYHVCHQVLQIRECDLYDIIKRFSLVL